MRVKYVCIKKRFWIFFLEFYKLRNKWALRVSMYGWLNTKFEISTNWE